MFELGKMAKKTFNKYKARARAKIKRLEKKGFNVSKYLDFDLKPNFSNRKEYNAWKRKVDNFTKRSNTDFQVKKNKFNVQYLGVEKKKLNTLTQEAIDRAKEKQKELNSLPVIDSDGNKIGNVGEEREVLKDQEKGFVRQPTMIDIEDLPSRNVIEKRIAKMEERSKPSYFDKRNAQMRENWIGLMRISFGEDADTLISKVNTMDLEDFVELFWMFRDFKFEWYDSNKGYIGDNQDAQLIELEKTVDMFLRGGVDRDLKNFR